MLKQTKNSSTPTQKWVIMTKEMAHQLLKAKVGRNQVQKKTMICRLKRLQGQAKVWKVETEQEGMPHMDTGAVVTRDSEEWPALATVLSMEQDSSIFIATPWLILDAQQAEE